jgi:putative MATE family efflux protein
MHAMDLTKGNIRTNLLKFALPYLGASFLQALYGATDLFVVGRFEGPSAISAVNIGSQLMQIITSFVIGCSMGSTVLLAGCVGSKNKKGAVKGLGSTIILFILLAAILTPIMILSSSGLVQLLRTPQEAVREAVIYVRICSAGIPFIIAFNGIAAVLRGLGDSRTPMKIVAVACMINIGGDFLLTGLLGMGVAGVAVATVAAQAISSVYGIYIIRKHQLPFSFHKNDIRLERHSIRRILTVGLPIALQDACTQISFILITVIANTRGLIDSSAVGVVEKLIMFMFLMPIALMSSISAVTAQNIGAGKLERAVQTRNFGIILGISFGVVMCLLSWMVPSVLNGIFTNNHEVILKADEYLKTYSIDCILTGCTFCLNGYLSGMGKSIVTFVHNMISIFAVRIPAAWILSHAFPDSLMPMGLASPLGSCTSLLILIIYFRFIQKDTQNETEHVIHEIPQEQSWH